MPIQSLCCCNISLPCNKWSEPRFDIDYICDNCSELLYVKRGSVGSKVIGNLSFAKTRYYSTPTAPNNPMSFVPTFQPDIGNITLGQFTFNGITGYGWYRRATLSLPVLSNDSATVVSKSMNVLITGGGYLTTPTSDLKISGGSNAWSQVRDGYLDIYLEDSDDRTLASDLNNTATFLQAEPYQYGRVLTKGSSTNPLSISMDNCDISSTHAVAVHSTFLNYSACFYSVGGTSQVSQTFTENCKQAKAGKNFTLLLMTDGTIKGFSGTPASNIPYTPARNNYIFSAGVTQITLAAPSGRTYAKIASGENHFCVVDSTGVLTIIGDNTYGQTNIPWIFDQTNTNKLACIEIVCGLNHNVARDSTGKVHCWGRNNEGQSNIPSGIINYAATKVFAGGDSSMMRYGSSQYGWGRNDKGQCPTTIASEVINEIDFTLATALQGISAIGGTNYSLSTRGDFGYIPSGLRGGAKPSIGIATVDGSSTTIFTGLNTQGKWFVWSVPNGTQLFYDTSAGGNCLRVNPAMCWLQTGAVKEQPAYKTSWREWQTGMTITGNDTFGSKAEGSVTFEISESSYQYTELPNGGGGGDFRAVPKYTVPCANIGRATITIYQPSDDGECIVQGACPNALHPNDNLSCPEDNCGLVPCTYTASGGCSHACFNAGCSPAPCSDPNYPYHGAIMASTQFKYKVYGFQWDGESQQNANSYAAIVATTASGSNPYNYTLTLKNCGRWNTDFSTTPPTQICGGNYCGQGTYYVQTTPITICANKPACTCPCTNDIQRVSENISNSTQSINVVAGQLWRPPDFTVTSVQNLKWSWGFRNCSQNCPDQCSCCSTCIQSSIASGGAVSWTFSDALNYPCNCFGTIDS